LAARVVAEAVAVRLERREGMRVSLGLGSVHAAGREGHFRFHAGVPGGLLDRGVAAQHDQVGERHLLARGVELLLDRLELLQHRLELSRLIALPVLLRREANARAVGAATLVGAAEGRGRRPGRPDQLRDREPDARIFCLSDAWSVSLISGWS